MKKLITTLITVAFLWPFSSFAIQEVKRTGKIETDEHGGYSDAQRDHHVRRSKQIKDKTGAGYYEGGYHSTGDKCTDKEWQFVECKGKGGSSKHAKSYKKVKEGEGKEKKSEKKKEKKKEK